MLRWIRDKIRLRRRVSARWNVLRLNRWIRLRKAGVSREAALTRSFFFSAEALFDVIEQGLNGALSQVGVLSFGGGSFSGGGNAGQITLLLRMMIDLVDHHALGAVGVAAAADGRQDPRDPGRAQGPQLGSRASCGRRCAREGPRGLVEADAIVPTCAVCGKQPQTETRAVVGMPKATIRCCPHHDGYFYLVPIPCHGDQPSSQMVQWRQQ